jgi:hypothetical protein
MPDIEIPFDELEAEVKLKVMNLLATIDTDTIQIKFKTKIPKPGMPLNKTMEAQYIFTIRKPKTRTTQALRVDVTATVPKDLLQIEEAPTTEQISNLEKKGWFLSIVEDNAVLIRTDPSQPFMLSGLGLATGAITEDVGDLQDRLKHYYT